jgi:hypothetical protein
MAKVGNLLKAALVRLLAPVPVLGDLLERLFGPAIPFEPLAKVIKSNFRVDVLRPDDLLVMRLDFYNVSLVSDPAGAGRRLVRTTPAHALVGVTLPPQSFGERTFDATHPVEQPPIDARLSGATWLLFRVPKSELLKVPYTLTDILALLRRCEPVVTSEKNRPVPLPPPELEKGPPPELQQAFTAVAAPYRLYLSPQVNTRWAHADEPVTDAVTDRTELWHTRLRLVGSQPEAVHDGADPPKVHAVWNVTDDTDPFPMPLTPNHREQIVDLSSNTRKDLPRRPVTAEQLMLSSLGAWLRVHVNFSTSTTTDELPTPYSVLDWRHRMTMGRDQFVRVVELGRIFPFGHKAVKITITERKPLPLPQPASHQGAYLMQRVYVSIREPERSYAYPGMPLDRVRIAPLLTPEIVPASIGPHGGDAVRIHLPQGGQVGSEFLFDVTGRDLEGRTIGFETPLFWVSNAFDTSKLSDVIGAYKSVAPRPIRGRRIAYAPSGKPGATSWETSAIRFSARPPTTPVKAIPFLPVMEAATVRIEAVETMTGQLTGSEVRYEQRYLDNAPNPTELYLNLVSRFSTKLTPQVAGGLAAPNFEVGALSRFAGPVSLAKSAAGTSLADGTFTPEAIFPSIKVLGGIDLGKIVKEMLVNAGIGVDIPNLTTTRTASTIETRYEWATENLKDIALFTPEAGARLSLLASFKQELDPATGALGASSQKVEGSLTNFAITLLPPQTDLPTLVKLGFRSVIFTSIPSKKTDVAVKLKQPALEFLGPLRFVNELATFIPLDGFSDPPSLDVTADGVSLGYSLGIPTIGVGVFTLANISFSAGFYLPFLDGPIGVRLAFCERPQPFTLTVYGLGGGGFFGITFGLGGVQMIEMALEFGAALALNLGVASGSVSVMGGVYYQKSGEGFILEAYIRMNGSLRVLGLISVTCVFYLSLTYLSAPDLLKGQASLSLRVKIAFFSKTVSVTVERELKGSDPTFREVFTSHQDRILEGPVDDWAEYAGAFAAYA